jgi:hypothetical protein
VGPAANGASEGNLGIRDVAGIAGDDLLSLGGSRGYGDIVSLAPPVAPYSASVDDKSGEKRVKPDSRSYGHRMSFYLAFHQMPKSSTISPHSNGSSTGDGINEHANGN